MANNTTCHEFACYLGTQLADAITDPALNQEACFLSTRAKFHGAMLTAFVGAVVSGITSSSEATFFVGWTAWFPVLRICLVGIWELCMVIMLRPLEGGHQFFDFWHMHKSGLGRFEGDFFHRNKDESATVLGCFGWLYSALWAPTREILWLLENWHTAPASLKIVRALGVAVAGIPLTIDTRNRYGALLGTPGRCVFNLITASSCMTLGVVSAMLMVLAVIQAEIKWYFVLVYTILSIIWGVAGISFCVPHDYSEAKFTFCRILGGVFMGAFSGFFLVIPAFILGGGSPAVPGIGVFEYIRCESVATWQKVVAIGP